MPNDHTHIHTNTHITRELHTSWQKKKKKKTTQFYNQRLTSSTPTQLLHHWSITYPTWWLAFLSRRSRRMSNILPRVRYIRRCVTDYTHNVHCCFLLLLLLRRLDPVVICICAPATTEQSFKSAPCFQLKITSATIPID